MTRKPKAGKNKKRKAEPVTTSRLPVVKCGECTWSKAILPGQNASELLTAHYQERHAP